MSEEEELLQQIPLKDIRADPQQARKYFDEESLKELANDIERNGLQNPITIRPDGNIYRIIHGERRFRAHKILKRDTITSIVREVSEEETHDLQLSENIQREDLSPIELAREFKRRIEKGQTQEEIAQVIGKSRAYVTQRLQLLRLSDRQQEKIAKGEISFSVARELVRIKDEEKREQIGKEIDKDTSIEEVKKLSKTSGSEPTSSLADAVTIPKKDLQVYWILRGSEEEAPVEQLFGAYMEDLPKLRKALKEQDENK